MSLDIYATHVDGLQNVTETIWMDSKFIRCKPMNVYEVSADSEELKRALHITGLPQYGDPMNFYGDTAKHIVGNWFN